MIKRTRVVAWKEWIKIERGPNLYNHRQELPLQPLCFCKSCHCNLPVLAHLLQSCDRFHWSIFLKSWPKKFSLPIHSLHAMLIETSFPSYVRIGTMCFFGNNWDSPSGLHDILFPWISRVWILLAVEFAIFFGAAVTERGGKKHTYPRKTSFIWSLFFDLNSLKCGCWLTLFFVTI